MEDFRGNLLRYEIKKLEDLWRVGEGFLNKEVECSLRFKENSFGKKGFYINF